MRIGEAAAAVGMTTKALRFYEKQGLLPPAVRAANGYRDYPDETLDRLEFIRRGKVAGLPLSEIRGILRVRDAGQTPCTHVTEQLAHQLAGLDRQIAELTAVRKAVAENYRRAAEGNPDQCDAQLICSYL
jgi:DNA-binding transcriptional MerR regulator